MPMITSDATQHSPVQTRRYVFPRADILEIFQEFLIFKTRTFLGYVLFVQAFLLQVLSTLSTESVVLSNARLLTVVPVAESGNMRRMNMVSSVLCFPGCFGLNLLGIYSLKSGSHQWYIVREALLSCTSREYKETCGRLVARLYTIFLHAQHEDKVVSVEGVY
ncbi:hypothetical protein BDBG_16746 [Blastomyces gilchristii SLH14081]|uniref:Uncharacterized protein n=1 Tax=Blastomyces gilchristii (strain SLH14081) TaxID=559298 RepID=A0A179UI95_BLAGS|nr:uncharacterized protein BDBG_16746 [Blastomyces gilchristii SLH14081]EQL34446.1 hypothetical protein BDFG_03789 [Blastomyces dermatitidis ATCC 26199]OAT06959.1 hypothetical protein BDBG_16746 [Blastomyces gilchristii SLH14081]